MVCKMGSSTKRRKFEKHFAPITVQNKAPCEPQTQTVQQIANGSFERFSQSPHPRWSTGEPATPPLCGAGIDKLPDQSCALGGELVCLFVAVLGVDCLWCDEWRVEVVKTLGRVHEVRHDGMIILSRHRDAL